MTITEAIQSYPALEDVKQNLINKACLDREISGDSSYSASVKESTDLIAADLMVLMATHPEFREGDLSIKYPASELKSMAKKIYDEYDDPKASTVFTQPGVSNASNLW